MSTATPEGKVHIEGRSGPGPVVAVVGPTGAGKSVLADSLALALRGEIVSADSMQVYRGMDIGTAKTPVTERGVAYHCIDLVDPGTPYSAALYQRTARERIDHLLAAGLLPVIVGGTGLYVRAALDDWEFPSGESGSPHRARLEELAARIGPQALHRLLAQRDPGSAAAIHPANVRRTIRALEMAEEGTRYAEQAAAFSRRSSAYAVRSIGLTMERTALYTRIDDRVDAMVAFGLLGEVSDLLDRGFRDALTASQAIGYKEIVPVIEGECTLPEATAAIQQATRRYAKRQMSWFRGDERIEWIDTTDLSFSEILQRARVLVESQPEPVNARPSPGTWRLEPDPTP